MKHDIKGHYIKKLSRFDYPNHVLFIDTETKETKKGKEKHHTMKIAWSCLTTFVKGKGVVSEQWKYWTEKTELLLYIRGNADLSGELWILGNNIFFDLQVIGFFPYFATNLFRLDFYYENGLTYILTIKSPWTTIKVVSMTNYFSASVKELGKMLNLPKLEVDFKKIDDDLLSIYCFRDTEIIVDAFAYYYDFISKNDLGGIALSRASQSMKAFRMRFMRHKIYCHSDSTVRDLEARANFGGRTEAFRLGKISGGPFVDLDINSMYPFVMKTKKLPLKCVDYYITPPLYDVKEIIKDYGLVVDAEILTDLPMYPVRIKNRVMFPVGRFRTCLNTPSIIEALRRGHLKKVYHMACYEMDYIFSDFIDYFYAVRLEAKKIGNKPMDTMAKILMNSLYGKWGQFSPIETLREPCPVSNYSRFSVLDLETGESEIVTEIMGVRFKTEGREPSNQSVLAIPSHVTDHGRMILWRIMEGIGREKVLYCDTDCVKIRESDLSYVNWPIDENNLGSLKVESRYDKLEIFGLKDYKTDRIIRLKGVPRSAKPTGKSDYTYDQFQRQKYHMRENITDYFVIKEVEKHLLRKYTKGKVNHDGTISAWKLPAELPLILRSFR